MPEYNLRAPCHSRHFRLPSFLSCPALYVWPGLVPYYVEKLTPVGLEWTMENEILPFSGNHGTRRVRVSNILDFRPLHIFKVIFLKAGSAFLHQ